MGCGVSKTDISLVAPVSSSLNLIHINQKDFMSQYKVENALGQGSYGEVRTVIHKSTGQIRAVKVFRKDQDLDNSYIKVKNEIELLSSLSHPCIIKMFEFFEDSRRIYLILEKCSGGELFEIISQRKTLTENDSAVICKQLFSAISYLHGRQIVHRDLKPENILLEDHQDILSIKIIDFGTAAKINRNEKLNELVGSPFYISPEVILGSYSEECDMWSCGVILFILLSGKPPFDGKNNAEIFNKAKSGRYTFENPIWNAVSGDAKDLIGKLLCQGTERLTACEALNHNWVRSMGSLPAPNAEFIKILQENMRSFSSRSKLHEAVTAFISSQVISSQETKQLREVFKAIDTNGDGKLSREELTEGMIQYISMEFINNIMDQVDLDKNGFIDLDEFLHATLNQQTLFSLENLKKAFCMFDLDGNGKISYDELKTVLGISNDTGEPMWGDILKNAHKVEGDEIDFQEFCLLLQSID